jgi:alpha-L-rhamnosidase
MRNRAPFIWTPRQSINPMGFLAEMLHAEPRTEGSNRWFLLRHQFHLAAPAHAAPIKITCDGRYQLFVNGTRIGRGPVRSQAMALKYDSYDIARALVPGDNVISVIVHCFGVDTAWYEMVRGMWQPTFGDGGLWLEGEISSISGTTPLCTSADWKIIQSDAWDSATERMNAGLGFIESLDMQRLPANWMRAGFDDSQWENAQILHVDGGGPDAFFGGLDTEPFPILAANPLPPLAESLQRPQQLVAAYHITPQPELPLHQQLYQEPVTSRAKAVERDWQMRGDAPLALATNGMSLLFRFDALLTGYPYIDIDAKGGEVIDIAVAERLPNEYEGALPVHPRIIPTPVLGHDAHIARFVARAGKQRLERFEWSAARWMQITIRNAEAGIMVHDAGVVHTHYPATPAGAFASNDIMLDQLWEMGRTTLQLCMHDGWEDCPSREQRQWLGDVTVEHAAAQTAFGPSANALTAKYLRDVADSQRPDGLTQMFAPGDHGINGLLIPDWTLQWILTAGDYLTYAGDVATIDIIFPAVQRALAWFERLRDGRALVADMPYWHFMDWSAVGRKGEATTLNAQLAGALKCAAEMADAIDYPRAAQRYRDDAKAICTQLNAQHWDESRGVYVDMVDPATGVQNPRVSQHANAAMILWGDAPHERWESMVARITDPARVTFTAGPPIAPVGEPLDEVEGVVLANTFYAHFVYSALAKAGRVDLALHLMRDRYGPMLAAGAVSLWESYGPTASLCHGFSASPTYQLTTHVLGLQPLARGFAGLRFNPDLAGLTKASGTLATIYGDVRVSLERAAGSDVMIAVLDLPSGLAAQIHPRFGQDLSLLPGGQCHRLELHLHTT